MNYGLSDISGYFTREELRAGMEVFLSKVLVTNMVLNNSVSTRQRPKLQHLLPQVCHCKIYLKHFSIVSTT